MACNLREILRRAGRLYERLPLQGKKRCKTELARTVACLPPMSSACASHHLALETTHVSCLFDLSPLTHRPQSRPPDDTNPGIKAPKFVAPWLARRADKQLRCGLEARPPLVEGQKAFNNLYRHDIIYDITGDFGHCPCKTLRTHHIVPDAPHKFQPARSMRFAGEAGAVQRSTVTTR